ncbi:unnamed protein product, partial [Symbiodinium sp. KB8]
FDLGPYRHLSITSQGVATRPSNARALRSPARCIPHVGGEESTGVPEQGGDAPPCTSGHVPREKAGVAKAAYRGRRC